MLYIAAISAVMLRIAQVIIILSDQKYNGPVAYIFGEISSILTIGVGFPQASFFLEIFMIFKMEEAEIKGETVKAQKILKCLYCTKFSLVVSMWLSIVCLSIL